MDTKTALLDSAEAAVRERGFNGFSYADLAAVVGINKASIHHHFPTKADLALALIDRYSARFFEALDEITASRAIAGERLKVYIGACRGALDSGEKLCLCVAFCVGRDGLSPAVQAKLNIFHGVVAAWLTDVFAAGQSDGSIRGIEDAAAEGQACLAQMEGAQLVARAAKDVGRFDESVALLVGRIC